MAPISKHIVFYVAVLESNAKDHSLLRRVIHRVLPQAIVDSLQSEEEVIRYFNNCNMIPHLIFLAQNMLQVSGHSTVELIKGVNGLSEVPIVFLSAEQNRPQSTVLKASGEVYSYSKPFQAKDLLDLVSSPSHKWLA